MYVARITGQNFMRLRWVDVHMENGVVEIAGKNRQGKTTLLKMIEALGGKAFLPEEPVTKGQRKGSFTLQLNEGDDAKYLVTWSFTEKDSYLKLEAADGSKITKPQDLMSSFITKLIDPWRFARMACGTPAERREALTTIKSLMDVSCDVVAFVRDELGYDPEDPQTKVILTENGSDPIAALKALEENFADTRKGWKADIRGLEGVIEAGSRSVPLDQRDVKPVDVAVLIREKAAWDALSSKHERAGEEAERLSRDVEVARVKLQEAEKKLQEARQAAAGLPTIETGRREALDKEIAGVEQTNALARRAEALKQAIAKRIEEVSILEEIESGIDRIRAKVEEVQSTAKLPSPNISVRDNAILLNGLPFEQASSAEQLTASLDIAMSLNPPLKVCVCQDASLLDSDSRKIIEEKSKQYGYQVLLEIVQDEGQSGPGVIFVEDGVAKD